MVNSTDTGARVTKYQKLVDELEEAIKDGRLKPGAKLPSVRELMRMHGLSLSTVTTALHLLEERGLVEPKARSGYFVKTEPSNHYPGERLGKLDQQTGFHWWPDGDLFPRERLRKLTAAIVRRHPDLAIHSPRNNNPRLIRELAKRCAEIGCYVHEEHIVVTHGTTEALSIALRAATSTADQVLLLSPLSPLHQAMCDYLQLEVVPLETRMPEADVLERLAGILAAEAVPRVLLLSSNFHCPTGDTLSLAAKKRILELAQHHGAVIIEDDSSGDLHFDPIRPLPIKAFDPDGSVIYVNSATKSIAPGLQVGWVVSGETWHSPIEEYKSISSSAVDDLPQLVLAAFLAQGSHLPHLRKLRSALQERAQNFEAILQPHLGSIQGLEDRNGGFNRFLSVPGPIPDEAAQARYLTQWPEFFTGSQPFFRFKSEGLSVNLSFPVSDRMAGKLAQVGARLLLDTNCEK